MRRKRPPVLQVLYGGIDRVSITKIDGQEREEEGLVLDWLARMVTSYDLFPKQDDKVGTVRCCKRESPIREARTRKVSASGLN